MTLPQTKVRVFAFTLATGAPVTGGAGAITAKWAKDYGTPTALTDTNPTEAEDGFYYFDLTAAERDVTIIGEIFPESSTSGVQVIGVPGYLVASVASVTVVPSSATVARRAGTNYILMYTQELGSVSITVLDGSGGAVDLSGKTLGVYWETESQVVVSSLTSGITVGGAGNNVVTFALPSAVSDSVRELIFAVRDQSSPFSVYAGGVFDIRYLPGPQ